MEPPGLHCTCVFESGFASQFERSSTSEAIRKPCPGFDCGSMARNDFPLLIIVKAILCTHS
jgi:hypothetical protein